MGNFQKPKFELGDKVRLAYGDFFPQRVQSSVYRQSLHGGENNYRSTNRNIKDEKTRKTNFWTVVITSKGCKKWTFDYK